MLKMAEVILWRADKEPTPEQLAQKTRSYAESLHNEMLAGLTALDLNEELAGRPIEPPVLRAPPRDDIPTLGPSTPRSFVGNGPSCPNCTAPMKKRRGPNGSFWGCTKFPACQGTRASDFGP